MQCVDTASVRIQVSGIICDYIDMLYLHSFEMLPTKPDNLDDNGSLNSTPHIKCGRISACFLTVLKKKGVENATGKKC